MSIGAALCSFEEKAVLCSASVDESGRSHCWNCIPVTQLDPLAARVEVMDGPFHKRRDMMLYLDGL
jgi:hypothetical protein